MADRFSEHGFLSKIKTVINEDQNLLGHNEDAIAIKIGQNFLVINIDGWVASSDRPQGMTAVDCGFRAVANAVSDVIVKGAIPQGMIISLSINKKNLDEIDDIMKGFVQASKKFNIPYLGGDLNSSIDLVIDVVVWGTTKQLIRRSGAQVGDLVCWIGPVMGASTASLGILTKNWQGEKSIALKILGRPELYFSFINFPANSSIDCSDGLARTLYLLAEASNVGIELDPSIHVDSWVNSVAIKNNKKYTDMVYYGGDELGIVFTCSQETELLKNSIILGRVVKGDQVSIDGEILKNRGWDHFSNLNTKL